MDQVLDIYADKLHEALFLGRERLLDRKESSSY